ncbi:MAG: hypothetical protein J6G98_01365 [Bacilli bacterium]|nr:hypothetical protein [Bacilli bacterium]
MKKIIFILTMLLIPFSVMASEYKLSDMNINVSDDWYTFTKDNIRNNQDLKLLGVSEEYMNNLFASDLYRLDAIKFENDEVIELFVITKDVNTLNTIDMTDDELNEVKDYYKKLILNGNTEVFKTDNNNYIKAIYSDKNLNIIDYYATYNNVGYTVKIQRKSAFSQEEINKFDEMVKNITFGNKTNDVEPVIDTKEDGNSILTGAIIGAIIGSIIGLIGYIIKNRK